MLSFLATLVILCKCSVTVRSLKKNSCMRISNVEFRQHPRKNVNLPVILDVDQMPRETRSLNVSSNGIALFKPHDASIQPGQTVTVRFSQPRTRTVKARVVHVSSAYVGLTLSKSLDSLADIETRHNRSQYFSLQKKSPLLLGRKWLNTQARRAATLLVNTPLQPYIIDWVKPDFLFAAYGTHKEAATYMSPWMKRVLPPTIIGGLIRANGKTGFMVAATDLEDTLYSQGAKMRGYLHDLTERFPHAKRIALVGRLPNFARKAGVQLQPPFVDGSLGTRFMILDAALEMRGQPAHQQATGITVLGGAGRIGDQVCQDLLNEFAEVIAYDPRYLQEEIIETENGRLIRTSSPARLKQHRLFIGLTHHGDAVRELLEHLPAGSLLADDTHPCISLSTRRQLAKRGIETQKIVLTHPRFSLQPRMPAWNAQDIPGCLVEALVLLENGDAAVKDFRAFSATARHAGFSGILVAPPHD